MIELPAGTVLRVKLDQRFDANGNVVRDRVDIRTVQPDGTKIRIRIRAPEIEVNDLEIKNGMVSRQRGRDAQRREDRNDRVARGDRPERIERRGGNSGEG